MLTIIAKIESLPQHSDFVKQELIKLIPTTKSEEGCVQYDLHQDNNDPARFLFYENWTSRELWQIHMRSAHLQAYNHATEGMIANFTLYEMSQI
jgi:quinol monooxygenase YgiN